MEVEYMPYLGCCELDVKQMHHAVAMQTHQHSCMGYLVSMGAGCSQHAMHMHMRGAPNPVYTSCIPLAAAKPWDLAPINTKVALMYL